MRDYYLDVLKRGITAKGNIWLVPWVRVTPSAHRSIDGGR
jgi:hypothetical protein